MRRATNGKRGHWVDVVYRDKKGKLHSGYTGYWMEKKGTRYLVAFTAAGEHVDPGREICFHVKVHSQTPIEPPTWGRNMWVVMEQADKANHYAMLYDAKYKSVIEQGSEIKVADDLRHYRRQTTFLESLKHLQPWA